MTAASAAGIEVSPSPPERHDLTPEIPADAAIGQKRRWGCGIVSSLALATPLLLLFAAYVALVWSNNRVAEEAIAKARAAGDPVDVAGMEAYYPASPEYEEATAHWLRATKVCDDPAFGTAMAGFPSIVRSPDDDGDQVLSPGDSTRATAFVDRYREAIDEAHAARRAGSIAAFPLEWQDGIAMLLQHVQNLRGVNRLLEVDLEVKLALGDVEGAVEDLLSMIATSESLSNEPVLVSQLVRIACLSLSTEALERLLARTDLTDEQLARIQEAFARQHYHEGLRRAYRGEQFWAIHTMQVDLPAGDAEVDWARKMPLRGADLSKTLELWRPVMDASDEGILEGLSASQRTTDEVEAIADSPVDRLRYPMTLMFLPAMDASASAFLRGEANARLAETAVACERYRLANGELPAKLDELVQEYLPAVPADPCDLQPLRYVVTESGATLYSIGTNQADDGGHDDPEAGDITFELSGKKSPAEEVP